MDIRFYCTLGFKRVAGKSSHDVNRYCDDVRRVLALNPRYGVQIPGHSALRKMRMPVPHCKMGKSQGYRIIYRAELINEAMHVIMLAIYYKGRKKDLTAAEYDKIQVESTDIVSDTLSYEWADFTA